MFRRRSKTSKLRVTGLYEGNPPLTAGFPSQGTSNAEMFPFDDVIIRVKGKCLFLRSFAMIFQFSDKRGQGNLHSCKEFQNWFIIPGFYSSVLHTRTFRWFVVIFRQRFFCDEITLMQWYFTTNELVTNISYNTDLLFDLNTLTRKILLGSVKRLDILPWATKAISFTWNSQLEFNLTIWHANIHWLLYKDWAIGTKHAGYL